MSDMNPIRKTDKKYTTNCLLILCCHSVKHLITFYIHQRLTTDYCCGSILTILANIDECLNRHMRLHKFGQRPALYNFIFIFINDNGNEYDSKWALVLVLQQWRHYGSTVLMQKSGKSRRKKINDLWRRNI